MSPFKATFSKVVSSAAGLLLLAAGLGSFATDSPLEDAPGLHTLPGRWEVTRLTGSYTITPLDTNPSWCEKGEVTIYPIVGNEETFIRFTDSFLINETEHIPEENIASLGLLSHLLATELQGLFVFQFSFDNGHHSNEVLEAKTIPLEYIEYIKGLWSATVGYWGKKGESSGIFIEGRSVTGTKWGGLGDFRVFGRPVSDNRIEGTWEWTENTAGPFPKMECRTTSKGSGTWVAVRR